MTLENKVIHRLPWPRDRATFDAVIAHNEPTIFSHALDAWPALSTWTPDWFAAHHGAERVRPQVWGGRTFADMRWTTMDLATYVARMRTESLHLPGVELAGPFAALLEDAPLPIHLTSRRVAPPLLAIGRRDNYTPLHLDVSHNLYAQVHGRRRVVFIPPSEAHRLYQPSLRSPHWWASPVDVEAPDLARFPRFSGVVRRETIIVPGELLFIPSRHRHAFTSLDETVSISFFWEHDLAQRALRRVLAWIGRPSL